MTTMRKPPALGELLKSEADPNSRIAITATKGTKIGELVKYEKRNQYLVALSNEEHGKVLVQPWNCVIDLNHVSNSTFDGKQSGEPEEALTAENLAKEGDVYGIKYIGTPYTA